MQAVLSPHLKIPTADVFLPLLAPADYKGAYGGRSSGKSHFFAEMLVEECLLQPGTLAVCIREVQKALRESAKRLVELKIQALGVGSQFDVLEDRIRTPGGGVINFLGMQNHTAETFKSYEGVRLVWIEEGQTISERSLSIIRPTMFRVPNSSIWCSWNPRLKSDAVDRFFRQLRPEGSIAVPVNWRDNPWFPPGSDKERRRDLELYPDRYGHIWEGDYATALEGSYFASSLALAKAQGRIGRIAADPLLPIRLFWDIGGASASADHMAIGAFQWVGPNILFLDYMEGRGQVLAYYVNELRKRGYQNAHCTLPHDGVVANNITGKRYEDHLRDAEFSVDVIPNQGAGAAMMRVEALRRVFPKMWFNEGPTEPARDALGYYHEKRDEDRNIGLGPEHDFSSHCADMVGLMAVCYREPWSIGDDDEDDRERVQQRGRSMVTGY